MRKDLFTTCVTLLTLGFTSTTYAASNPFIDVPKDNWAYQAVEQLHRDGVLQGYPQGTFDGHKALTRFEMAELVARAMTKENISKEDKTTVDKLEKEYSQELKNLGVQVSNLENKEDRVHLSGSVIYQRLNSNNYNNLQPNFQYNALKYKINPTIAINDKVQAHGNITYVIDPTRDKNTGRVVMSKLNITNLDGSAQTTLGRFEDMFGNGLIFDDNATGLDWTNSKGKTTFVLAALRYNDGDIVPTASGKDVTADIFAMEAWHQVTHKLNIGAGVTLVRGSESLFDAHDYNSSAERNFHVRFLKYRNMQPISLKNLGKEVDSAMLESSPIHQIANQLEASYQKAKHDFDTHAGKQAHDLVLEAQQVEQNKASKANIYYVGASYIINKNLSYNLDYAYNPKADDQNKAYSIQLNYKGANTNQPGSYGAFIAYRYLGENASISPTYNTISRKQRGVEAQIEYIPAKNIDASITYFRGKNLPTIEDPSTNANETYFALQFLF